jgi:uncharacterized protein
MSFYNQASVQLQDRFQSRRIADRLLDTRVRHQFSESDRELIETANLFFLATADAEGRPDCSVKGGDPGFVRINGANSLVFPSYDGNGMFRSLGNIMVNPAIGLLFVEFSGQQRRLRINGTASIADDPALLASFAGAQLLVQVTAEHIFPNCPRYLPNLELAEPSVYNPRPGYEPPEPFWKSKPDLKDYVTRKEDRAQPQAAAPPVAEPAECAS